MDRKKGLLGPSTGMRTSLMAPANVKTPTRQRFSAAPTSGTRRESRFSLSGVSGGNTSRRLSLFKQTTVATRVNTSDKAKQQVYIKKIVDFITDLEGEGIATPANVARPTMSDFITFVNCIYEDLNPNYTLADKKLVEEVPRFFAVLGYPYPIKHSYLQPIGAAHNWHYLLHAICWMIDLNKMVAAIQSVPLIISNDDYADGNTSAVRYSWLQSSFKEHFASKGDESVKRVAISKLEDFFENQENYKKQAEELTLQWNNLRDENKEYDNQRVESLELERELENLIEDIKKAENSTANIKREFRNVERVKIAAQEAVAEMRNELAEISSLIENKKEQVILIEKTTGITTEDALRMKIELETNTQVHKQLRDEFSRCGMETRELQSKFAQGFSHLLSRLSDFIWNLNDYQRKNLEGAEEINTIPNTLEELHSFVTYKIKHIFGKIHKSVDYVRSKRSAEIENIRKQIGLIENQLQVENEKLDDVKRVLRRKQINKERSTEDQAKERQYIYSQIAECENEKETLENIFRNATGVCVKLDESSRELERVKEYVRVFKLTFEDIMITNTQKVTSILEAQQIAMNKCESVMWEICEYIDHIMKSLKN